MDAEVLVVDDEPSIRDLLAEALELNGFSVRTGSASGSSPAAGPPCRRWRPTGPTS
ncbi:response regulator [Herbidospora solisilvae]|uniref:hypothetical protein n=1 Tax=Herbidospora solisilvae TaxID=2696284 RepID=UPI0038B326B6